MDYLNLMKDVLRQESDAILAASEMLEEAQVKRLKNIFENLVNSKGSLIFVGVGKSGQIGEKLAATFSSLGLPSYFLHPTEALHGDLGRVKPEDYFVLISKSGSTDEIFKVLPFLSNNKEKFIGLIGNKSSVLARRCGICLDCSIEKEACINNQAPTTSTTVTLALGDAMAVLFEKIAGLSKESFAVNHPGGLLGKSLLMTVKDIMWKREDCARVSKSATLNDLIVEMTSRNLGACAVLEDESLLGIVVEGDFRRALAKGNLNLSSPISDMINHNPIHINDESLAVKALELMENNGKEINILPVLDRRKSFSGFIRLHDLIKEGFSFS